MARSNTGLDSSVGWRGRASHRDSETPCNLAASDKRPYPETEGPSDPLDLPTMPRVSSITPERMRLASTVSVRITIPSLAGVEHDAGNPRMPSICTRQVRQAPMAGMSASLHSCESGTPAALTASNALAPASTLTAIPSTVTLIVGLATTMLSTPALLAVRPIFLCRLRC